MRIDFVLYEHLRRHGERLAMTDQAVVAHLNETTWSGRARGLFHWYRCYAVHRARSDGWSFARRALYVAATPVVPFYFLATLWRRLARTHPELLPRLWRSAPLEVFTLLWGATGQALGLLFGEGESARRFSESELNEPRPEKR